MISCTRGQGREAAGAHQGNVKNVRFNDLCQLARLYGFQERARKGSHRVYSREGMVELLNFQSVKGMAKPYQVRQFLQVIERYGLKPQDDE